MKILFRPEAESSRRMINSTGGLFFLVPAEESSASAERIVDSGRARLAVSSSGAWNNRKQPFDKSSLGAGLEQVRSESSTD